MKEYVTFAVQAGGPDANDAVYPYYMALRRYLAEKCSRGYGSNLTEFAFILRIDGSIGHWNKYGCDYLRVSTKTGVASIDIFMPERVWKDEDRERIKSFLVTETRHGFRLMLERAVKKGMEINAESFMADFESALEEFHTSM